MNKSGFMFFVIGLAAVLFAPCLWYHAYFAEMSFVFLLLLSMSFFLRYIRGRTDDWAADFTLPSALAFLMECILLLSVQSRDSDYFPIWLTVVCGLWLFSGAIWLASPIVYKFYSPFNRASAFLIFLLTACVVFLVTYFALESSTARYISLISGVVLILQNQCWYYADKKKAGLANREQRVTFPIVHFIFFGAFNIGLVTFDNAVSGFMVAVGTVGTVALLIFHFVQWIKNPVNRWEVLIEEVVDNKIATLSNKENFPIPKDHLDSLKEHNEDLPGMPELEVPKNTLM
jgi:hypothetical protein